MSCLSSVPSGGSCSHLFHPPTSSSHIFLQKPTSSGHSSAGHPTGFSPLLRSSAAKGWRLDRSATGRGGLTGGKTCQRLTLKRELPGNRWFLATGSSRLGCADTWIELLIPPFLKGGQMHLRHPTISTPRCKAPGAPEGNGIDLGASEAPGQSQTVNKADRAKD